MCYYSLDELLELIEGSNAAACKRVLADNRARFQTAHGSVHNHQAWTGGYFDHVQEAMNIGLVLWGTLHALRKLPFSASDVLLIIFLHDIEKPWKYEARDDGQLHHTKAFQSKSDDHTFRSRILADYGIALTPEQTNALKYVEGEFADYSNRKRVMGPLAGLCHMADVASARIWFDHPFERSDPWIGASRIRDGV